jgi:hypothetical protein
LTVNFTDKGNIEKLPPLHLVSRISQLAPELQNGILENIFGQVNNFNQHDPTQDYLKQVEIPANYYLQNESNNLN